MNSRNLRTMAVKEEEKEALVPLLCVFKNGTLLHSILLSDPEWEEEENNADSQEKIVKVGRHPDCDIVVDHPSISRWHLQIQLHKSSQELLLTDLSSVHGTFVCGQRATPKVPIALQPDDTFRMGASTRVYKLQWLPYPSEEEEEDCRTPKFLHSVYEPNKHECASDGENEQALTEEGYVRAAESNSWNMEFGYNHENKEQALMEERYNKAVESAPKNQECACAFDGENKEQALKKESYVGDVGSNSWITTPTLSDVVSACKKQECGYTYENKELASRKEECGFNHENEQASEEDGYVKAVESTLCRKQEETTIFLECVSETNKQECTFGGENKEQTLKEHRYVEAVESVRINPIKTPIFLECVSEPNKGNYAFPVQNKEQVLQEHGYVESVLLESFSEPNKQECASEPSEQALEEHIYVDCVPSNQVKTPIFLESISEPNKHECEFSGENQEKVLEEHGYVEPVGSVLSNLVKTPIFLESFSEPNELDCAFAGENKEHASEEHRYVGPVPSKTPIFLLSVSEPNKQECVFSIRNKEQVLKEHGYVEAELVHSNLMPILSDIILEPNKQECGFDKENQEQASMEEDDVKVVESNPRNLEQALKEHGYVEAVESVPSNQIKTPIFLEYVSEPNKQDCTFAGERGLKEQGYVESVPSNPGKTPIIFESFSEPNESDRAFAGENKEQVLKEHEYVEPVPSKPVKTPTVLESVSECNKQKCAVASERKEQVSKEHGYVEAEHVHSNLIPILSDIVFEPNKQECGFDEENKEQASMKEGDAKVVKSDPRDLECRFVDKKMKQYFMQEEYVEPVESIPWKPVQPSAPPLPESPPQQNIFVVVTDAEMKPLQENQSLTREKNTGIGDSNLWSRRQKDGTLVCLQTGRMEINLKPKKMMEKLTKQKRTLKENSSAEIILKENHGRHDKKRDTVLQVLQPETSAHGSSSTGFYQEDNDLYPSDKENWTPKVPGQASKATTRNFGRVDQEIHPQTDTERAPFQSLSQNSRVNNRPTINSSLKNTNKSMDNHQGLHSQVQVLGRVQHPNLADLKKKWHMVVDTDCLVHEESRQALKQLEGIKGTHLIIPRIVIRELDCLKRQNKSKKGKEAQEIFRWIDECMVSKGWWIHVQNSTECFTAGVTPPASPHSNLSDGSIDASASVAFSSYGSFAVVLSPTAEDHILECALHHKRLATSGRVVLLSNDVALKIKAMAEGMLCENAKEFCQSLVSPYSERFLWSQSTAHGHNWTDINNSSSRKPLGMMRKSTYFGMMRKSLLRDEESKKKSNEGAKGLKLILLHNSQYGQKKHI